MFILPFLLNIFIKPGVMRGDEKRSESNKNQTQVKNDSSEREKTQCILNAICVYPKMARPRLGPSHEVRE
jgi:hypothetical protein